MRSYEGSLLTLNDSYMLPTRFAKLALNYHLRRIGRVSWPHSVQSSNANSLHQLPSGPKDLSVGASFGYELVMTKGATKHTKDYWMSSTKNLRSKSMRTS